MPADVSVTARVVVNRIWRIHFGRGLVASQEDFGSQGKLPTHPELLDWLAGWFMDNGWDVKALHRLIVSSATFQQSTQTKRAIVERDPENRLLTRAPKIRLPAEHMQAIDQLAKATNTRRRHLSVHERGRVILVPLDQVIYLKAELKYITVRTREREYLIEESLTSLEEEFGDRFVRIHRNALVARPSIAGFERVTPTNEEEAGDPYWQVVLRDIAERLPVSRRQWSMVKNLVT